MAGRAGSETDGKKEIPARVRRYSSRGILPPPTYSTVLRGSQVIDSAPSDGCIVGERRRRENGGRCVGTEATQRTKDHMQCFSLGVEFGSAHWMDHLLRRRGSGLPIRSSPEDEHALDAAGKKAYESQPPTPPPEGIPGCFPPPRTETRKISSDEPKRSMGVVY